MDFIKELGGSRRYTFHSHTQFCDGRAQMEAFAREAVARGFTHYGFSPHSPVPIESPCNMALAKVPEYLAEVERIRGAYGDRCRFYAGMEVDYLGDDCGPSDSFFHEAGLDYIIGSVHFIRTRDGEWVDIDGHFDSFRRKMERYFQNDIRYVAETYFAESVKMLEKGGFDILGHFDKVGHNASSFRPGIEEESWYRALVDDYVGRIIASGVTVELNTKAWQEHGRLFPSPWLLPRLVEAGVPLIVNSDAHVPALVDASRDRAFALLDSLRSCSAALP